MMKVILIIVIIPFLIGSLTYVDLKVQFNQAMYSGEEASGVIMIVLNLLGGTASKSFAINILTSPVSAIGKHSEYIFCECHILYRICVLRWY